MISSRLKVVTLFLHNTLEREGFSRLPNLAFRKAAKVSAEATRLDTLVTI